MRGKILRTIDLSLLLWCFSLLRPLWLILGFEGWAAGARFRAEAGIP